MINLKIIPSANWSATSAKVIATIPSSAAPTSFQAVGLVTIESLPSKHGAWLNTDSKIRLNIQEAISSGTNIYVSFFYAL